MTEGLHLDQSVKSRLWLMEVNELLDLPLVIYHPSSFMNLLCHMQNSSRLHPSQPPTTVTHLHRFITAHWKQEWVWRRGANAAVEMDESVASSSNSTVRPTLDGCFSTSQSAAVFQTFFIGCILLLPLFILVLHVGYQRWRKQVKANHSEVFTYNLAVLELVNTVGLCVTCCSVYIHRPTLLDASWHIFFIVTPAQTLLHLLTCVDRYLAVVHPVTYLRLKQAGGVRNVGVGCVWLLSAGSRVLDLSFFPYNSDDIFTVFLLVVASVVISFCSVSVLRVLIRPGPGEVGGHRERVDQSKRRAFSTIVAILGALLLKLCSALIAFVVASSAALSFSDVCLMIWSLAWCSLPSSLVLPLLFLQRAAKLPGRKRLRE